MEKFVPSQGMVNQVAQTVQSLSEATDVAGSVALIEGPFTAAPGIDESAIPWSAN